MIDIIIIIFLKPFNNFQWRWTFQSLFCSNNKTVINWRNSFGHDTHGHTCNARDHIFDVKWSKSYNQKNNWFDSKSDYDISLIDCLKYWSAKQIYVPHIKVSAWPRREWVRYEIYIFLRRDAIDLWRKYALFFLKYLNSISQ